jgi:hypothetical protein
MRLGPLAVSAAAVITALVRLSDELRTRDAPRGAPGANPVVAREESVVPLLLRPSVRCVVPNRLRRAIF